MKALHYLEISVLSGEILYSKGLVGQLDLYISLGCHLDHSIKIIKPMTTLFLVGSNPKIIARFIP